MRKNKIEFNITEANEELLIKLTQNYGCASYEEFLALAMNLMDAIRSKQEEGFTILNARNPSRNQTDRISMPSVRR